MVGEVALLRSAAEGSGGDRGWDPSPAAAVSQAYPLAGLRVAMMPPFAAVGVRSVAADAVVIRYRNVTFTSGPPCRVEP